MAENLNLQWNIQYVPTTLSHSRTGHTRAHSLLSGIGVDSQTTFTPVG